MAPSGAGLLPTSFVTDLAMSTKLVVRTTPFDLVTSDLSTSQTVLLTHLVVWLLTLLSGIFLGLRFFAIWYRKLVLVADDGLLMAAWVLVLFYATMTSLELALGIGGGSSSSGGSAGPSPVPLLDNVARTLALTAMAWSKSAFICGLLGTQPVKRVRLGLLALVGVLNAVVVGTVVFHWVRCKPLHKAWDVDVDGTCFGWGARNAVQITAQAYSAFMDIALVGLGYLIVWSENLRRREKAAVAVLATLGLLASATSIITAVEVSALRDDDTLTKDNIGTLLAASLEAPLTILIASLPALRLLRPNYQAHGRRCPSSPSQTAQASQVALTTDPFAGFRPPRPHRPSSARSFLTDGSSILPPKPHYQQQQQQPQERTKEWMKLTHTIGAPPATPTSTTSNKNMGHKRGGTSTSTENLLPGINYDYARWNSASSPQHSPGASSNNHHHHNNISAPPSASLPVVTPPASRGGLFASALPPLTTSASVPNLNQQHHHQQQHPRPATGRSTTSNFSNNSTSTLLAAREYLSSPSPSPPGSPTSPTTPSALPLLLATPAAAVSNTNGNGNSNSNNKNSDKNNNTNNDETAPAGGLFSLRNKRLTTLQEESESMSAAGAGAGAGGVGGGPVSWASSAVRSSMYSSEGELFDMYLPSGGGGSGGGGLHAPMRSRDSPTLGGWAGWANAGRKRQEDDEAQQQQRTPSSLGIKPLQTRQKEPTTGWRVW